ncbi:hypothetical protein QTP88_007669 [Uroleucon formosanum]
MEEFFERILSSTEFDSHIGFRLLNSPKKRKGLGNCLIILFKSLSSRLELSGKYMLQMQIGFLRSMETAMTSRGDCIMISLLSMRLST